MILEHEHYGPSKKRGAWSDDLLVKSVEEYHSSYMSIHWWPREDPRGDHAPPTKPGEYDVFVSVGMRDGTPQFALPLPDSDGQKRYRMGKLRLTE